MAQLTIATERLEIISATIETICAEIEDKSKFSEMINARIGYVWPPEAMVDALAIFKHKIKEAPDKAGLVHWYWILRDDVTYGRVLIGSGGFCGLSPDGTLMIGYWMHDDYHNQGYGTEAVKALVEWAFCQKGVKRIIADTYPYLKPSIRVLEKNGFKLTGAGSEENAIRYELKKAEDEDQ